jgi:DNA repair exonuclease SbcCD ATPase subunit
LESLNNPLATINNTIDKKIDVLRKDREEAKAQRAKLPPPEVILPSEATGAIEDVSYRAAELSAAMEAPVNDVAQLLIRQNDLQKTQASFKAENEELKESIAKLAETTAANRKLIEEQTEMIQHLKTSLEAASELQRTPPPPAEPPAKVMLDDLRAAVDDVLRGVVSRDVVPTLDKLRSDCLLENRHYHQEVFEVIWDKIEPSLKIAEAVNRWASTLEPPAS